MLEVEKEERVFDIKKYMAMKDSVKTIKCDDCQHEWRTEDTKMFKQKVMLNGKKVILRYFVCPNCFKKYVFETENKKYSDLKEKYQKNLLYLRNHKDVKTSVDAKKWEHKRKKCKAYEKEMLKIKRHIISQLEKQGWFDCGSLTDGDGKQAEDESTGTNSDLGGK